jgi:uncharacterized membrane protein
LRLYLIQENTWDRLGRKEARLNLPALGYVALLGAFGLLVWLTRLLALRLARYLSPNWRVLTYLLVGLLPLYQTVDVVVRYGKPWRNPFWYFWLAYFTFCGAMAYVEWRRKP